MLSASEQRSIAVPEDLLLQLQRWMEQQLGLSAEATSEPGDGQKGVAMLEELRRVCGQQQAAAKTTTAEEAVAAGAPLADSPRAEPETLSMEKHWEELRERMCLRCTERVMAWEAEDAAYEAVLRFAEEHGERGRELAGKWIDVAAASARLNSVLRATEKRWIARTPKPAPREESPEEKEERERRRQARLTEIRARVAAEHEEWSRLWDKSPGYHAVRHRDATEPCDKWAGPYQDLRLIKYCEVCGLTGVDRADGCPNFSQHQKWLDGLVERYTYSEC